MKRCALYARVSTVEQGEQGKSLEAQMALLEAYARRQDWRVTQAYQETASTWTGTRDEYDRLMEDARQGRFDCILDWKLDRFGRRAGQIHTAIEELKALNIDLILVSENVNLTQDGIVGKVLTSSLALTADLENEIRSERAKMTANYRRGLGLFKNGKLPSGYRHVGRFQPSKINEEVAGGIVRAFELYATGRYSIVEVSGILNAGGYHLDHDKPYSYRNLGHILTNRHYTGRILVDGKWVKGREPVIISDDLFERVQRTLLERGGAPRSVGRDFKTYLLTGILRCAHCGSKMYAQTIGQPDGRRAYYRCKLTHFEDTGCPADREVSHILIREDTLAPQVDELIDRIRLPQYWRELIRNYLSRDRYHEIEKRRRQLRGKLERLNELYIEGHISKDGFSTKQQAYSDELANLIIPDEAIVINAGGYLEGLRDLWGEAKTKQRHGLLRTIFRRLWVDRIQQRLVAFESYPEFEPLFRQVPEVIPREGDNIFEFVLEQSEH